MLETKTNYAQAKGKGHEFYEDAMHIGKNYWIIADGLGSSSVAKEASSLAVTLAKNGLEEIAKEVKEGGIVREEIPEYLNLVMQKVNEFICSTAKTMPEYSSMHTTLDIGMEHNGVFYFSHVGDSRIYLHRAGNLTQLTKDHVEFANGKKYTLQAIGKKQITPQAGGIELKDKDILLLTTDGLTDVAGNEEIQKVFSEKYFHEKKKKLKRLALKRSKDDITMIFIRCFDNSGGNEDVNRTC